MNLGAQDFARILSFLTTEGLTTETGRAYAASATRDALAQIHVHAALIHLQLARALPDEDAWPFYDRSRDLWEDTDERRAARAARIHAHAHLKRGYPGQAAELLDTLPGLPELAVPHAWALIGVGRYQDALNRLNTLSPHDQQVSDALAARAVTLIRLGRADEATTLADRIGGNSPDAAHAESVRAHAARMREHWEAARRHSQIAADLWNLHGDDEAHLTELGMVARAQVGLGSEPHVVFGPLLQRARNIPSARSRLLLNYVMLLGTLGQRAQAEALYPALMQALREAGDTFGLANVHINCGVDAHESGDFTAAAEHYRAAITHLRGTGNTRLLGVALSNLSEIDGNLSAFEDALTLLTGAGQYELVTQIRRNAQLQTPPDRRSRSDHAAPEMLLTGGTSMTRSALLSRLTSVLSLILVGAAHAQQTPAALPAATAARPAGLFPAAAAPGETAWIFGLNGVAPEGKLSVGGQAAEYRLDRASGWLAFQVPQAAAGGPQTLTLRGAPQNLRLNVLKVPSGTEALIYVRADAARTVQTEYTRRLQALADTCAKSCPPEVQAVLKSLSTQQPPALTPLSAPIRGQGVTPGLVAPRTTLSPTVAVRAPLVTLNTLKASNLAQLLNPAARPPPRPPTRSARRWRAPCPPPGFRWGRCSRCWT
ncbi:hypothetical protein [Deinococcus aquaticus]|uniref:hypothetical protein n=1 Tax=Deinococcus aquaticus TaxID=328692 RepID=UPI00361E3564